MKITNLWKRCAVVIFLMTTIFSGCRSAVSPVKFYTLSSIRAMESQAPQASPRQNVTIGIGPAQFPDYLDRPQIVTRSGPNTLKVSEFKRWGGKLDQDFINIFADNLSILLATDRVVIYPWKAQVSPDYRIALDVHQFEGQIGDSVLLNVTWTLQSREGGAEALPVTRSIIHQPVSGQDYDAMVSAYSQAVAELSREVAAVINNNSKRTSGGSQ
jgi:uncharacterized protein